MFEYISSSLSDGVLYIREHPQLLFTLLLILVVPFAFLITAQQFLTASKENQERLEKDRIGLMHDVFASFVLSTNGDFQTIQKEITTIAAVNPDIRKFRVAVEENDSIIPKAALDESRLGEPELVTDPYEFSRVRDDESIIFQYFANDERFWQGFRSIKTDGGEVIYIFTETSLASIDALFAQRIREAYYWLFGLLAVVLLLVVRHVRLIDYGHLYQKTKEVNQTKDLFTNMIAHELRAPLTAMRGYASMIHENENIPFQVREQGKRIEESSERLVVIVSDLLDVARIQSGKLSVTHEVVNVSEVVVSVIESLQSSAAKKNIELTHTGTEGMHNVTTDGKRLHQAITNIVSNAIKYTEKGSIELSLQDLKDRIELRIKDTGMGISAEDQKKLFAPFVRVNSKSIENIAGTGLGMWITKQLIELMGASIGIESIKGVGTHVVVTLPKTRNT